MDFHRRSCSLAFFKPMDAVMEVPAQPTNNKPAPTGNSRIAVPQLGADEGIFWANMRTNVFFVKDFAMGIFKSVFFGFAAAIISLYEGYYCLPTAGGVAQATTRTVVKGSLAVLALNFVLTAFMVE